MDYQHRVSVWNYETGIKSRLVCKSRAEAEAFMAATQGDEKCYTAELGDWPYGRWTETFDSKARQAAMWDEAEARRGWQ